MKRTAPFREGRSRGRFAWNAAPNCASFHSAARICRKSTVAIRCTRTQTSPPPRTSPSSRKARIPDPAWPEPNRGPDAFAFAGEDLPKRIRHRQAEVLVDALDRLRRIGGEIPVVDDGALCARIRLEGLEATLESPEGHLRGMGRVAEAAIGWPGAGIRIESVRAGAELEVEAKTGALRVDRTSGGEGRV